MLEKSWVQSLRYHTIAALLCISTAMAAQDVALIPLDEYLVPESVLSIISIDLVDIPLKTALQEISTKGDFHLNYNHSRIPLDSLITVQLRQVTAWTALRQIATQTGLQIIATDVGDIALVHPKTKSTIPSTQSISGFVRENSNGEPIAYANVFLTQTAHGTTTNEEGYFVITNISTGIYELNVTMIGYQAVRQPLHLETSKNTRVDIRLIEDILHVQGITVEATRSELKKSVQSSQIRLDMKEIEAAPAFLEADVFRTLQLLPGVQTANDFSSALYVRGSTPDQNLILLDGITVYNPSHLGGIFSTFNTDAINDARFQAGGFPARYGGRMGATLNVINREGNTEKITGSGNISLISSKGLLEGPIPTWGKIKGAWMVSGRRTYLDRLVDYFSSYEFPYYFYDYQVKAYLDIGINHRLTFTRFYGEDVVDFSLSESTKNTPDSVSEDTKISLDWPWGNRTNGLTWRWLVSPTLVAKTFLSTSNYRFNFGFNAETNETLTSSDSTLVDREKLELAIRDKINDHSLDTELVWKLSDQHMLTSGIQHKQVSFDLSYELRFATLDTSTVWKPLSIRDKTQESAIYIQDQWIINPMLSLLGGLRATKYSLHDKLYLEPRLSIKYAATDQLFLKYNWGIYRQFLITANNPDEVFRIVELWTGVPSNKKAPRSTHNILGLEYITASNILYRLEAYYKGFDHLLTLKEEEAEEEEPNNEPITTLNDFWDTDAKSYGLELLIKKASGRMHGWIGYTYARTKYFTPLSGWYAPNFDRSHTLNIVATLELNPRSQLNASISSSSGNPYTPVLGRAYEWSHDHSIIPEWTATSSYLVGEKNTSRYKPYFRLDIGYVRSWGSFDLLVQAVNITNHTNTLTYQYRTKTDPNTGNRSTAQRRAVPMFPFMLTCGVRFAF